MLSTAQEFPVSDVKRPGERPVWAGDERRGSLELPLFRLISGLQRSCRPTGDLLCYRKPVFAGGAGGAGLGGDGGVAAGDCLPLSFADSLAGSPCPSIPLLETS